MRFRSHGRDGDDERSGNRKRARTWQVPINAMVSKVVKIGRQRVSFAVSARYYVTSPDPAAKGWGARFAVTFLFPTAACQRTREFTRNEGGTP